MVNYRWAWPVVGVAWLMGVARMLAWSDCGRGLGVGVVWMGIGCQEKGVGVALSMDLAWVWAWLVGAWPGCGRGRVWSAT
jgi:hypothetical protein